MDPKDAMLSDLRAQVVAKDVQLRAAVALAGRAAIDLKKYRDLTIKLEGIREITLHQRRAHAEACKDHDKGCQWDLGLLAYLASSMGITANNFAHKLMKGMLVQYDAAIRKAQGKPVQPLGQSIDLIAQPSVGTDIPVIGRTATIKTQATVHVFKKGAEDAGRPVQQTQESQECIPGSSPADVQGPRPDSETTRRRSDQQGSAPK